MRYQLQQDQPALTTTKEIGETKDGEVARLMRSDDKPLSAADEQKEAGAADELLGDPASSDAASRPRTRTPARALKVLRALPARISVPVCGLGRGPAGKPGDSQQQGLKDSPSSRTRIFRARPGDAGSDRDGRRNLDRSRAPARGAAGRPPAAGCGLWLGNSGAAEQGRLDRDRTGRRGRRPVANRALPDGDERPRRLQDPRLRHHGRANPTYAPVPVGLGYQKAIEMLRSDPKANELR